MSQPARAALRRSAAPLALMALIFYVSGQSDPGPELGALGRIVAHAGEYALLCALWLWSLSPVLRWPRLAVAAAGISIAYAISDEYHQGFVPGRDPDPLDVAVDTVGIALVIAALALRLRYVPRR